MASLQIVLLLLASLTVTITTVLADDSLGISATPHASYSSSIGVLGCKINTNRVAYWPIPVTCNDLCVKVTLGDRSLHLLRIDQSGGAYDMSYDAWNWLQTGKSATKDPIAGGGVAMTYENASASACSDLIHTDGLPLSAANSMNFLFSCLADQSSWVAQNYVLFNIQDSVCSLGYDEKCSLDWESGANQPTCPHTLGLAPALTSAPVYNIEYPSGQEVLASTGQPVSSGAEPSAATALRYGSRLLLLVAAASVLVGQTIITKLVTA